VKTDAITGIGAAPTSTPHQHLNAQFRAVLGANVGECRSMLGKKIRQINGLPAKRLKFITY
jgi:hypothetical protein